MCYNVAHKRLGVNMERGDKFRTVRLRAEDKAELDKVQVKTRLSRVELLSEAVKMLKRKHRVKDDLEA